MKAGLDGFAVGAVAVKVGRGGAIAGKVMTVADGDGDARSVGSVGMDTVGGIGARIVSGRDSGLAQDLGLAGIEVVADGPGGTDGGAVFTDEPGGIVLGIAGRLKVVNRIGHGEGVFGAVVLVPDTDTVETLDAFEKDKVVLEGENIGEADAGAGRNEDAGLSEGRILHGEAEKLEIGGFLVGAEKPVVLVMLDPVLN